MHDVSWKQDLRDFRIWKWTSRISHIPWCKCIAVEFVAVRIKVESIVVYFNGCVNLNLVRTNFFKSSAGSWASSIVEFFYFFYYCYPPLWTILVAGSPTNNALDPERLVASSNLEMGLKRNTIYLEMARLGHSIRSKRRPTKNSKLVVNSTFLTFWRTFLRQSYYHVIWYSSFEPFSWGVSWFNILWIIVKMSMSWSRSSIKDSVWPKLQTCVWADIPFLETNCSVWTTFMIHDPSAIATPAPKMQLVSMIRGKGKKGEM